jgi:hypothetical protein
MPGVIEMVRTIATLPISAHRLAIGPRAPVRFTSLDRCHSYHNGSQLVFPFGGPMIGTIAPGQIPKEPKLRFGVHLPARSSVRFRSNVFELYARGKAQAELEAGEMSEPRSDSGEVSVAEAFAAGAPIRNRKNAEAHFLVHVFSVSKLPSQFVIRTPDVCVCGIWFRVPDFAYRYFSERKSIGLCGWG